MNITTPIGFVIGLGALAMSVFLEGGELTAFVNVPAALVVFGGTFGAALVSFPGVTLRRLHSMIGRTFVHRAPVPTVVAQTLVRLAERARREGLLALEEELPKLENSLIRRGVMLVIDGTDPDLVRSVLQADIGIRHREQENEVSLLEAMGGYAPTMGIIGTVMGLVHVLGQLTDPSKLGGAIAVAFIATFYGVSSANLLWLPLASKLRKQAEAEALLDEMILEGIASIQSGENPRILQERLDPYLYGGQRVQRSEGQEEDAVRNEVRQDFQPREA